MKENLKKDIYDKEAFFIIEVDKNIFNEQNRMLDIMKIEDALRSSLRVFPFYGGGLNRYAKYQFGIFFDNDEWDFENSSSNDFYGKKSIIIKKREE